MNATEVMRFVPALFLFIGSSEPSWGQVYNVRVRIEPHHASTEFEGMARGMGVYYEGLGAGLKDYAEAQVRLAEAQSIHLRNYRDWLEYRAALKREYAQRQALKRGAPASAECRAARAKVFSPAPLSYRELAHDGVVIWPVCLLDTKHAAARGIAELALQDRGYAIDDSQRVALLTSCDTLALELRARIRELPAVSRQVKSSHGSAGWTSRVNDVG
jgi:hypothetical protein